MNTNNNPSLLATANQIKAIELAEQMDGLGMATATIKAEIKARFGKEMVAALFGAAPTKREQTEREARLADLLNYGMQAMEKQYVITRNPTDPLHFIDWLAQDAVHTLDFKRNYSATGKGTKSYKGTYKATYGTGVGSWGYRYTKKGAVVPATVNLSIRLDAYRNGGKELCDHGFNMQDPVFRDVNPLA